MLKKFSKPSGDIQTESIDFYNSDKILRQKQSLASIHLEKGPVRDICLLCHKKLDFADLFEHRDAKYVCCKNCCHIQSLNVPPMDYPYNLPEEYNLNFSKIYPKLDQNAYISRRNRIYNPKLEWILSSLNCLDYSNDILKKFNWMEFGSGAGYFLSSLVQTGITNCLGLERDIELVEFANSMTPNKTNHYTKDLAAAIMEHQSDIYIAFFVLEHINDSYYFWNSLKDKPQGTLFIFSVPTFGFSNIIENIFSQHSARSLDNAIHTQIYTQESIQYALKLADFSPVAEWVFGQDSIDLNRFIKLELQQKYPKILWQSITERLDALQDPFQHNIDICNLANETHIIAIKN